MPADLDAHPPEVSGVVPQPGFLVWAPTSLMEVRAQTGTLCLFPQAAGPLIRVRPPRVSVVGAQSANLGVGQQGFR